MNSHTWAFSVTTLTHRETQSYTKETSPLAHWIIKHQFVPICLFLFSPLFIIANIFLWYFRKAKKMASISIFWFRECQLTLMHLNFKERFVTRMLQMLLFTTDNGGWIPYLIGCHLRWHWYYQSPLPPAVQSLLCCKLQEIGGDEMGGEFLGPGWMIISMAYQQQDLNLGKEWHWSKLDEWDE